MGEVVGIGAMTAAGTMDRQEGMEGDTEGRDRERGAQGRTQSGKHKSWNE